MFIKHNLLFLLLYYFSLDTMQYHILIKMNIKMPENYDVLHCSVFWSKGELYLVLEWDTNGRYTLTQHTTVNLLAQSY